MQLEHLTLKGQTRDLLGLVVGQRNIGEIWSESNTDTATRVVSMELEQRQVRAECDRHRHEHGRHGHGKLEHHNEEQCTSIDVSVLW